MTDEQISLCLNAVAVLIGVVVLCAGAFYCGVAYGLFLRGFFG